MISVAEATKLILGTAHPLPIEEKPLSQSLGHVLREPIHADRDFPPFDRVSMDGIAIAYEAFATGRRTFQIAGVQQAGMPPQTLPAPTYCIEIMTGAMRPIGADTVIRYEDLRIEAGQATITVEHVSPRQNVHPQGKDRQARQSLVVPGTVMGPAAIAVAASVGKSVLSVSRKPRVAILSTGDELVPVDATPAPQQIRQSNGYLLQATLAPYVAEAVPVHLADDKDQIRIRVAEILDQYDLVVLSGGVSAGKADFIPAVMEELGVTRLFHKVQQRPGKPFWFGQWEQTAIFALPGNPVSTFVGAMRYVLPWLRKSLGWPEPAPMYATLTEDYHFAPPLTYFLQVQTEYSLYGHLHARPVPGHGSGDFANLLDATALMELPADREWFRKGESYRVWDIG